MDSGQTGKLNEFAIDALLGIIGGGEELLPILDSDTGEDIEYEDDETRLSYITPLDEILTSEDGEPLECILE